MIFFITYPDSETHWQTMYNNCITSYLSSQDFEYEKIVVDFFSPGCHEVLQYIQRIRSSPEDTWLLAWAQNPVIEVIEHKPGTKMGHVHGLQCFDFEPSVIAGVDLLECERFSRYDRIFLNSVWSYTNAVAAYPKHRSRFVVTGFPMDYAQYDCYKHINKQSSLVVFNQRFALERIPTLVIEIASRLKQKGYTVVQLSGEPEQLIASRNPDLGKLLRVAKRAGLEFVYNKTKSEYLSRLAEASVVITTSLCDNLPVSLLEAVYLDCVPIAPNALCFPEFIHIDNLYNPYALDEIMRLVESRPVREHGIGKYHYSKVLDGYSIRSSSPTSL